MADTIVSDNPAVPPRKTPAGPPPGETLSLFASHYAALGPSTRQASLERFFAAFGFHLLGVLAIVALLKYTPAGNFVSQPMDAIPFKDIVFLKSPGPGGGGGGGGNGMKLAPKKANAPVPVAKAPEPVPIPVPRPNEPPRPALDLPAKPNDVPMVIPGATDISGDTLSRGPGVGGGYGTGNGTGIGPGLGPGLGPGSGGGTGGGAYRQGSGVTDPTLLREAKPQYTADAMRAKIQGSALLECVVLADGSVGDCRILKSLDPIFGLDQEAIKAAKQFRFRPGRKDGQPVAVVVNIQIDFTLR